VENSTPGMKTSAFYALIFLLPSLSTIMPGGWGRNEGSLNVDQTLNSLHRVANLKSLINNQLTFQMEKNFCSMRFFPLNEKETARPRWRS